MSKPSLIVATAALALFAATAFAQSPARLETRKAMIDGVNPAALAIWDVTNAAMDDEGGLDPARLDAEAWGRLEESAQMLEIYGKRMSEAQVIVAGGPDIVSGALPPGLASRAQIQAMIDSDPDGFRTVSAGMAEQAAALVAAAKARDAAAAGELASGIDTACQSCHTRYWYLQEPAGG